jgi:hypothetical protein
LDPTAAIEKVLLMQDNSPLQLQQPPRLTYTQPSSSNLPQQAPAPWQLCWQQQLLPCLALQLWRRQQQRPKQQQRWFSRQIRGWHRLVQRRRQPRWQQQQQQQELTVLTQAMTARQQRAKPRLQTSNSNKTGTAMLLHQLLIKVARVQNPKQQVTLAARKQEQLKQQQQQQRQQWTLLLLLLRGGCRCSST